MREVFMATAVSMRQFAFGKYSPREGKTEEIVKV